MEDAVQRPKNNDVAAIADLAVKASTVRVVSHGDRSFLVVPDGLKTQEISDPHGLLPRPSHVKQALTVQTEASLGDYVDRFKGPSTILLADISASAIVALIDYHRPSAAPADVDPVAENLDHKATLSLPFSEEWKTWTGVDGKMMGQLEFARFIEENAAEIEAPSGAELLEVARDLQAVRNVDFRAAVRTNSDNENFEYVDETTAKSKAGGVEVPSRFELKLPVYFDGRSVQLFAFLRWKLDEGKLLLGVKLHRAEHVRQAVFKEIVGDLASRTGCPAVYGRT